ncbi:MAG: 16S rRNA (adenine(1518)-N(6)/adenine(1519)-N(6))-dimethyltransferase RsmA [Candidatus Zixiibacteriota bacterium]
MPAYHAKKRLGQNFLKSEEVIGRVIELLAPAPNDIIVEIGPGRGALALPLARAGATLWAVEFDRDLIGYLSSLLSDYANVQLLNDDFLKFNPTARELGRFKLVGNLPYNITSPVLDWCLRYREYLVTVVLMVQRELGARIAASPGSKDWSPLGILTQSAFSVERAFDVSAEHFEPRPDVMSTVVRLTPLPEPAAPVTGLFERVVRASFQHRRKTLLNNLVPTFSLDTKVAGGLLTELGLSPMTRAEELSIAQFLTLTAALERHKLL